MLPIKIEKVLADDLLEGNRRYVKKGFITFNKISFNLQTNGVIIDLFFDNEKLATMNHRPLSCPYGAFTLQLNEGKMKMSISD